MTPADGHGSSPGRSRLTALTPASFQQRNDWHLTHASSSGQASISLTWKIKGRFDEASLARSFETLCTRHDVLRTFYVWEGDTLFQGVRSETPSLESTMDLRGVAAATRHHALVQECARFRDQAFDLAAGPLIRARLYLLGADERAFQVVVDHSACDGSGSKTVENELWYFYAKYAGIECDLEVDDERPLQYAQYCREVEASRSGETGRRQQEHWRALLRDVPAIELPTDYPYEPIERARERGRLAMFYPAEIVTLEISSVQVAHLRRLAVERRVTENMVYIMLAVATLHGLSGQQDLCCQMPFHGRRGKQRWKALGYYTSQTFLRVRIPEPTSYAALLGRVTNLVSEARSNSDVDLVTEIAPARASRVHLNYMPVEDMPLLFREPEITGVDLPASSRFHSSFDLLFLYIGGKETAQLHVAYSVALFEKQTVERLLASFSGHLERLLLDPDRVIEAAGPHHSEGPNMERASERWREGPR